MNRGGLQIGSGQNSTMATWNCSILESRKKGIYLGGVLILLLFFNATIENDKFHALEIFYPKDSRSGIQGKSQLILQILMGEPKIPKYYIF